MSLYIKKFSLKEKHRSLKPFTMEFKDGLNVIVGENGAGKSTLLELIMEYDKNLVELELDDPNAIYRFFDTEKMNPRIKSSTQFSKNVAFDVFSRFMSHGEASMKLVFASEDFKNEMVLIDEPESGISLKNQLKILRFLRKIVKNNSCQVIIVTHSYPIIKGVDEVYSIDKKEWVKSKDYLAEIFK